LLECEIVKYGIESFTVIGKCQWDYRTKVHEALLIKKNHAPKLNLQLTPLEHLYCFKYFKFVVIQF